MQSKFLQDILGEVIGKQANEIINVLIGKKNVNEFSIAKKLKVTINQTRNLFYRLSNFDLVSFTRKKDKRKGWYTYFWTLNVHRALELLEKKLKKEIENILGQLKNRETKRFYTCKTCKTEVGEETALLHNFTCQECGEVYELNEDAKLINELRNKAGKLEKERKEVYVEIDKIRQEELKKNLRKAEKKNLSKKKIKKQNRREKKKIQKRKEK